MLISQLLKLLISSPDEFFIAIILLFVPLLISITIHEWAHGYTAYKFGDPTPAIQGRLSFNPFAHLDPVGVLMLFIIGIGWAKPVMINPANIRQKYKLMLVGLAGPLSNFVLGIIFSLILFVIMKVYGAQIISEQNNYLTLVVSLLGLIVRTNFVLGLFNLIPLPPLDGANVISNLLPDNLAKTYFKIAPFSLPILFLLMFNGAIDFIFRFAGILQEAVLAGFGKLFMNFLKI